MPSEWLKIASIQLKLKKTEVIGAKDGFGSCLGLGDLDFLILLQVGFSVEVALDFFVVLLLLFFCLS